MLRGLLTYLTMALRGAIIQDWCFIALHSVGSTVITFLSWKYLSISWALKYLLIHGPSADIRMFISSHLLPSTQLALS